MQPWLARHLVLPLHEGLFQRPTCALWRRYERTQWLAPSDAAKWQRQKLAALLLHTRARIAFYRDILENITPADILAHPVEALRGLPLLDKAAVRENARSLTWRDVPGGLRTMSTGGSTGRPLRFSADRLRLAADLAHRLRTRRWFGVEPGMAEVWLWGSPIELNVSDRWRSLRDRLIGHHLFDAFELNPRSMRSYAEHFRTLKPYSLTGYPSSLAFWADFLKHERIALPTGRLKAVFCTGETLLPNQKNVLAEVFQAPVVDGYGARDAGFIAHECPDGGFHVMAESAWIEILREDATAAEPGEWGEIVVTQLDALGMPLIRYRTGDVGRLLPGRCRCGRGLPLMDRVQGRQTDLIELPDGTRKHALSLIYALREISGLWRFEVIQRSPRQVVARIEAADAEAGVVLKQAEESLARVLGPGVALSVVRVDRLPPSASGKHRHVVREYEDEPGAARSADDSLHDESRASLRTGARISSGP